MCDLDKKKDCLKIVQCFQYPVREALVFTYYQTYTQDTDMYTYSTSKGLDKFFNKEELDILQSERRPSHLGIFVLFKVLKVCCSPSLASYDNHKWNELVIQTSSSSTVEDLLIFLQGEYTKFLRVGLVETKDSCQRLIDTLSSAVSRLVEKAAALINSKRWEEDRKKFQDAFSDIAFGNFMSGGKTVKDVVQAEAIYRAELYEVVLERNLEGITIDQWDLKFHQTPEEERPGEEIEFFALETLPTVLQGERKFCILSGEHGVGKSTFAAFFAVSWRLKCAHMKNLQSFESIIVISAAKVTLFNVKDVLEFIFPLSGTGLNQKDLLDWIDEGKFILIIVDDAEKLNDKSISSLYEFTEKYQNVRFVIMGTYSTYSKYSKRFPEELSIKLKLEGLKESKIMPLSKKWADVEGKASIMTMIEPNMNRLVRILKYPNILFDTCQIWRTNVTPLSDVFSASDLMWGIFLWKMKQFLKIKFEGKNKGKMLQWLKLASELAFYSLKAEYRLEKEAVHELECEIVKLFPERGNKFIDSVFQSCISHSTYSCHDTLSSVNRPFLEFIASWYLMGQDPTTTSAKHVLAGMNNTLPIVLFTAGLIQRCYSEGTLSDERRLIKSLITYDENSYDDFSFIQEFVAELKFIKKLIEIVIDETEYNDEWNLPMATLQLRSLEVLLSHVSPSRLIFLADNSKKNYELEGIMTYLCRVKKISLWLDCEVQFNYGNTQKLDKLVKPFLRELVAPVVDLISGTLSSSVMNDLAKAHATQHLVLLKLKVGNEKILKTALSMPKKLPNLLWLELKLDLDFDQLETSGLKRGVNVSMCDVHVRYLSDLMVARLADFLSIVNDRFTGIHLDNSSLTPEGVFTLLKLCDKRNIALYAKEEAINKFRRWYYPALSGIPEDKQLTEEQYIELIEHDDKEFYSDHCVSSSRFVTALKVWNLKNYLESHEKIVRFVYQTANIKFTKQLNGQVETELTASFRDDSQDNQSDSDEDSLGAMLRKMSIVN